MRLKRSFIVIYLFLAIYDPPIFSFNVIYILVAFAVLYLLGERKNSLRFRFSMNIGNLLIIAFFYILIVAAIGAILGNSDFSRNRLIFLYQLYFLMPAQFICAYAVCIYCRRQKIEFDEVIKLCIITGVLQGILSLMAWLFPNIQGFFLRIMVEKGGKSVYEDISYYRGYGFADTLLDTFGYGMGLLAGMCLLRKKLPPFYLISTLIICFSIAVNSRTGIAIVMVSVALKLFWIMKHSNYIKNRFIKIFFGILLAIAGVRIFITSNAFSSTTVQWIIAGFESVWTFLTGKHMQYRLGSMQGSMFTERFWTLPDNLFNLLFGTGHSVFATGSIMGGIQSDVGYVNYIWFCGIIGTLIVLCLIWKFFRRSYNTCADSYDKLVILFVSISFFVTFIKGNVLTHTAGTFLTILLCVSCMINNGEEEKRYATNR